MTYSIVYTSNTGNTALLAEAIREALPKEDCLYFGAPNPKALEASLLFVGFSTDKGTCGDEIASFIETLSYKQIVLFGTAGFGGSQSYFDDILGRVRTHIAQTNTFVTAYMCQGKMPLSVRTKYEALALTQPEVGNAMLENFVLASSHPDSNDLTAFKRFVVEAFRSI